MKGHLIANVEVADPSAYERYRSRTAAIVDRHGGRFLVRGGEIEALEGDPGFARLVIIEFPSVAAAHAFYQSPEYQEIIPFRTAASEGRLCIVAGVEG
jgi:uncharacterized protein (DUF1330 family)